METCPKLWSKTTQFALLTMARTLYSTDDGGSQGLGFFQLEYMRCPSKTLFPCLILFNLETLNNDIHNVNGFKGYSNISAVKFHILISEVQSSLRNETEGISFCPKFLIES